MCCSGHWSTIGGCHDACVTRSELRASTFRRPASGGSGRALGKLDVPDDVIEVAADAGCRSLPITWTHAEAASALPPYHADPFDRMLIAQAGCEGMTLASADSAFRAYEVDLLY